MLSLQIKMLNISQSLDFFNDKKLTETKIVDRLGKNLIHELSPYQRTEPRGDFPNRAKRVIRPQSTSEVSAVMSIINEMRAKVIPFCGGTGLVGGQMAPNSDFLLFCKLGLIFPVLKYLFLPQYHQ